MSYQKLSNIVIFILNSQVNWQFSFFILLKNKLPKEYFILTLKFLLAPFINNLRTILGFPEMTARCKGVNPDSLSGTFGEHPNVTKYAAEFSILIHQMRFIEMKIVTQGNKPNVKEYFL